ncbi:hypothetical protein LOK49_LG10G01501 [Camellia lanceoleosa]|uniref:Uncharacterized protein n=1 Tax=Camellia lanceoleosa TaxID=1840588 RepID=A0ACC0G977_9ERIC|nr:hypothetical protein LOK49_LG10G01501 [Camellia lanceoleosa]
MQRNLVSFPLSNSLLETYLSMPTVLLLLGYSNELEMWRWLSFVEHVVPALRECVTLRFKAIQFTNNSQPKNIGRKDVSKSEDATATKNSLTLLPLWLPIVAHSKLPQLQNHIQVDIDALI